MANGTLIPSGKRGIILYTVRDAISRDPNTTDLPSGFLEVFQELSRIGYKQIEFAGYNQRANAPGGNVNNIAGAQLLRSWLDDNGLEAEGNHGSIPSTITDATLAAFDAQCEIANILGFGHIGTGSDPTGSAYVADWEAAADRWNILGARAASHGLKLYTHNHDAAYNFLLDSGPLDAQGRPTRSSGIRRLEYFLANTDPNYVYLEMDIYWAHVAQYRWHTYTAPDGTSVEDIFDPAGTVAAQTTRFPLFHTKDGRINTARHQRLRDGAVRHGRHRLHDVLPAHRSQGLPQLDVRAGQRGPVPHAGAGRLAEELRHVVRRARRAPRLVHHAPGRPVTPARGIPLIS